MQAHSLFGLAVSATALLPFLVPPAAAAETSGAAAALFPFVLPWDDASPGLTDLSGWLTKPAGQAGHVRVGGDGHFYAGTERLRFLGVNLSFAGGMPTKEDAPKVAGRLARFGVNVVRFHHMDTSKWPDGLRARDAKDTGTLEPEALDRLHYFLTQLRDCGLYANLNLLVGRPFNAADGLPAEIEQLDWKDRHLVGFFDAKQLALQQDYARRLLTPKNPYTGRAPADDPCVAFVEINNEQGLVHGWLGGKVDGLPEVFLSDLRRQWNDWLKRRHGATATVRAAWREGAQPTGAEMLRNGGFTEQLQGWNLERHAGAEAGTTFEDAGRDASGAPSAKALKLSVTKPGTESWHVQLTQAGLALEGGKAYTLRFRAKADFPRTIAVSAAQAHEPWGNLGLSASPQLTSDWREFKFVFNASQSDDRARVSFAGFGGAGASVTLADVSLKPGGVEGLRDGESVEQGAVPLFARRSFGERTAEAQRDWMRFLNDTEDRYWQAMFRCLKDELQVKALVAGTIAGCAPLNTQAKLDWVDTHAYWQHPHFPGRPWDPAHWIVNNRTMVNERGGTLPGLALKRVAGKPHAVTEYNHPAPNTYSSEGFLLLAAYAALQDWDALYAYSYAHSRKDGWDSRKLNGFFDIDQHPTKMASLVAAAAMFTRGDVRPARHLVVADLPLERETDLLRRASAWSLVDGARAGLPREAALVHRVALTTEGRSRPAGALKPEQVTLASNRFVSDTGELTWDLSEPGRGVVTVNAALSKAVIGFGGGKRFALGDVVIEPGRGWQDGWSALTVTKVDKGRTNPARWLITAVGYAENTGMKWKNAEKSSVGRDWGTAPSRVEGVPARVTFPVAPDRCEAWSLDERGQRQQKLPVESGAEGKAAVNLGPQWQTLWYEVSVR
jgi:hypothetical protein